MSYTVAGIDIHKKVLMVVAATGGDEVADPAGEALTFKCRHQAGNGRACNTRCCNDILVGNALALGCPQQHQDAVARR